MDNPTGGRDSAHCGAVKVHRSSGHTSAAVATTLGGGATDQFKGVGSAFTGTVNFLGSGGMRLVANGGAFSGFNNALTTVNAPVTFGFYDNSGGNTFYFGALSGNNPAAAFRSEE